MSSIHLLPYELLHHVVDVLRDDYQTLARCCLVNRDFSTTVSPFLYRCVKLRIGSLTQPEMIELHLQSACLHHNRLHVKVIVLEGSIGWREPRSGTLIYAFQHLPNLQSVTLNMTGWVSPQDNLNPSTFARLFTLIRDLPSLTELVSNWVIGYPNDSVVAELVKPELRKLKLISVSTGVIEHFPRWLRVASKSLNELQIQTREWGPHYLSRFLSVFQMSAPSLHNLQTLQIGFLERSSDEGLFTALVHLPRLENLCLSYDLPFHRRSSFDPMSNTNALPFGSLPSPKSLKSFTLRYKTHSYDEYPLATNNVCRWIKHVISASPIEELNFIPFYRPRTRNPVSKQSWDLLIDHLADKHSKTLKYLDLRAAFVKKRSLETLLRKCHLLEELSIGTSRGSLFAFIRHSSDLLHLRRVRFELRTLKRGFDQTTATSDEVTEVMKSAPSLRRVIINDSEWLGSWVLDGENGLKRIINKMV
ncbi:hypothetical protein E1B28_000426 [Marasmius oreades]|uniref:F-box domain-containing protein n=1 Tax=Marasmius oreades TaxID=181124 RepID=A0A9P7V180_9AGAR|nr:uncharacterized protein E1B28_000426 [Marasmius oreades]KAG7098481.1 hypothetical protein E1B28_000426 [Marasmius oreades]